MFAETDGPILNRTLVTKALMGWGCGCKLPSRGGEAPDLLQGGVSAQGKGLPSSGVKRGSISGEGGC